MSNYFVDKYEGNRLTSYKCPAGIWTIGQGITVYPNGEKVKEGETITKEYSQALTTDYFIRNINPVIMEMKKNFTPKQKEALGSLIFNIGKNAFKKSSLYKAIMNDDLKGIFTNWDWIGAGGKPLLGLARRRAEELSWFLEGWNERK